MLGRTVGLLGGACDISGGTVGSAGLRKAGVDVGTSGGEVGSFTHSSGVGSGEAVSIGSFDVFGVRDMRVGMRIDCRALRTLVPESEMEREKSEAMF